MEHVIVTVKRKGEAQVHDLEVPVEMNAEALVQEIALSLGWGGGYEIYAVPPERVLSPHETLAQAGVWDGAWLVFQPSGSAPTGGFSSAPAPAPVSTPTSGPVGGWRPLGIAVPPAASQETPPPQPSGGFAWKRVDED